MIFINIQLMCYPPHHLFFLSLEAFSLDYRGFPDLSTLKILALERHGGWGGGSGGGDGCDLTCSKFKHLVTGNGFDCKGSLYPQFRSKQCHHFGNIWPSNPSFKVIHLYLCVFICILCVFVSLCVSVFVCNLGQHDHPAGRSDGVRDGGDWRNQCYQTS